MEFRLFNHLNFSYVTSSLFSHSSVLTYNKTLLFHFFKEPLQRYQRTPIDYSVLDNLGHGVKTPDLANRSFVSRAASTISHGSTSAHYPVFPNFEQLLPKANITATVFFFFFLVFQNAETGLMFWPLKWLTNMPYSYSDRCPS